MSIDVEKKAFDPLVGDRFSIHTGAGEALAAELIEVVGVKGDSEHREPFSVLFLGPEEPILTQRIYEIEHAKLGRQSIFLVPVGPPSGKLKDRKGILYEAVFT